MQKKLNEDYIDNYCEKFASKVTDSFFTGDKISITGKEILKITPSKQTNLFVIKLIFQYWQGESKKLESPFFNYENDSVKEALVEFMNVLSQNIEVHKNRFQLLLNHAVKDTIYLAASPQAYLEIDLDGVDVDKIDDEFVEENIKYIKIYKKDVQNFLLDMRGLSAEDAIDELADEFEPFNSATGLNAEAKLLSEILDLDPEKVLSEEYPEDFDEFDDDVFDNDDEPDKTKEVDKEPEQEKTPNKIDVEEKKEAPNGEKESIKESEPVAEESNELRFQQEEQADKGLIHPGWGGKQEVLPESMKWGDENDELTVEEAKPEEPGHDQEMTEPFEDESFASEESNEESPAPEKEVEVQDVKDDEPEVNEEPSIEEEQKESEPEPETINDQFEKEEKTVAEHHEEKKVSSIMELISVNHQFMFVKELFKDDQVSFQNALYELEEYQSFDEAVEFLVQGYAKEFEWDMQSNEVKELLKVLFRKFRD